jgi:hypothetical protein
MSKIQLIQDVYDDWLESSKSRLIIKPVFTPNAIVIHELEHDELRAVGVAIMRMISPPHGAVITEDALLYWGWVTDLLFDLENRVFGDAFFELHEMWSATASVALLSALPPNPRAIPIQFQRLFRVHYTLFALSTFPLIESMAKRSLPDYVDMDGTVRRAFPVPYRRDGKLEIGKQCNRVRDLLFLLSEVGDEGLRADLGAVRAHLGQNVPNLDGFQLIDKWRNSALHGETRYASIAGGLFTVATLIALSLMRDDFDERRQRTRERAHIGPHLHTYYVGI